MDEAQVSALIQAALDSFKATFTTEIGGVIDQKNAGLAANLTREIKKLTEKPADSVDPAQTQSKEGEAEGKLTLKMLQQQLQELKSQSETLKQERDTERQQALAARKTTALTQAIAGAKALNPNTLQKLLSLEFGDGLKEEGGAWLVQQGDSVRSLNDAIAAYLATDEGKAFVAPSGTAGAGSGESKNTAPPPAGNVTAETLLTQAFSSY